MSLHTSEGTPRTNLKVKGIAKHSLRIVAPSELDECCAASGGHRRCRELEATPDDRSKNPVRNWCGYYGETVTIVERRPRRPAECLGEFGRAKL